MKVLSYRTWTLLCFIGLGSQLASSTSLPRGGQSQGKVYHWPQNQSPSELCQHFAPSTHGSSLYLPHYHKLIFLSHKSQNPDQDQSVLLAFDLQKHSLKPLMELQLTGAHYWLLLFGPESYGFVKADNSRCPISYKSVLKGYSLKPPQKSQKLLEAVDTSLVFSPEKALLANLSSQHILDWDPVSFQSRKRYRIDKDTYPLAWDKPQLISLKLQESQAVLIKTPQATQKLQNWPLGSRQILQDQSLFGLIEPPTTSKPEGLIKLYTNAPWLDSKDTTPWLLPINSQQYQDAAFALSIQNKTLIITQRFPFSTPAWNHALIMDAQASPAKVQKLSLPKGHYVSSARFIKHPTGPQAVFIIHTQQDHSLAAIRIYDLQKNHWQAIHF